MIPCFIIIFFGGNGIDGTFEFDCKGPKVQYNSLHDLKEDKDFLICYPNPATDILFIETSFLKSNFHEKEYALELYTVKGELVKTECLETGTNIYRMNVRSLKNGIYILRLVSALGRFAEEVIIKE